MFKVQSAQSVAQKNDYLKHLLFAPQKGLFVKHEKNIKKIAAWYDFGDFNMLF